MFLKRIMFTDIHASFQKKKKDGTLQCFKKYKDKVEKLTSKKITILKSDDRKDFCHENFYN